MAGRGAQTFKKHQKEQQRKERQQAKLARRAQRKTDSEGREISGPEMGEPMESLVEEVTKNPNNAASPV